MLKTMDSSEFEREFNLENVVKFVGVRGTTSFIIFLHIKNINIINS